MNDSTSGGNQTENAAPWIAAAVGLLGWGAWADRNHWYAKLAPYGLTSEDTRTAYGGYGDDPFRRQVAETTYGTGHFHINAAGWVVIAIVVVGLVAGLWCVLAAAGVARWWASHGTGAVPKIPVPALAVLAAAAVFVTVLVLVGRQSSAAAHMIVFMVGVFLGVAAWWVVMITGMMPAEYWRTTQAFAGRADQVLGHGHPGAGRVRAQQWQVSADASRRWPAKLVAVTGPGWQHKPSELDELNRYAREFGWPPYEWRYDPMRKRITGSARPDVENL